MNRSMRIVLFSLAACLSMAVVPATPATGRTTETTLAVTPAMTGGMAPKVSVANAPPEPSDTDVPVITEIAAAAYARHIEAARSELQPLARRGPGLAVAVSVEGETVWLEGLGHADLESGRGIDPDATRFRIHSVSKGLTHLLTARLVQAGRLDLRAPVRRYLPEFPEKEAPIAVAQLLGHTAGIRHYRDREEVLDLPHCDTVADALPLFQEDPLVHPPGKGRTYSSWGYVLLSRVLEVAGGGSFDTLLTREVLDPAGADGIRLDDPGVEIPERAELYEVTLDGVRPAPSVDVTCKWGAGGYLATAAALAEVMEALRGGGLLAEPVFQELVAPAAEISEWGHRLIRVSGWSVGGTAFTALDLDAGTSVVLLGNGIGPGYGPAVQEAYRRILRIFSDDASGSG